MSASVHLVYFSCGAHTAYLELSLRSLARLHSPRLGRVYVGEDPEDPIRPADRQRLEALGLSLEFDRWGKVTGYGETTVRSQLAAFGAVAAGAAAGDWIGKVDSDVLFIDDAIFGGLAHDAADLVGHRERYGTMTYAQGGCYFVRAGSVARLGLASLEAATVRAVMSDLLVRFHQEAPALGRSRMSECPEDAATDALVRRQGGTVHLVEYYLPSWQAGRLEQSGGRLRLRWPSLAESLVQPRRTLGILAHDHRLRRHGYGLIHFQYCKDMMPAVYRAMEEG